MGFEVIKMSRSCPLRVYLIAPIAPTFPCDNIDHLSFQQAGYQKEEELYRNYENMAPESRMYIRRHEFETLEQLTRMATEYESLRQLTSSRAGTHSRRECNSSNDQTAPTEQRRTARL